MPSGTTGSGRSPDIGEASFRGPAWHRIRTCICREGRGPGTLALCGPGCDCRSVAEQAMTIPDWLTVSSEVFAALFDRRPVVALESTLISHGLPWPVNLETARAAEQAVRDAGAVPE